MFYKQTEKEICELEQNGAEWATTHILDFLYMDKSFDKWIKDTWEKRMMSGTPCKQVSMYTLHLANSLANYKIHQPHTKYKQPSASTSADTCINKCMQMIYTRKLRLARWKVDNDGVLDVFRFLVACLSTISFFLAILPGFHENGTGKERITIKIIIIILKLQLCGWLCGWKYNHMVFMHFLQFSPYDVHNDFRD